MNTRLDEIGLYPEVEAFAVTDAPNHLVLVDEHEVTVYKGKEGIYRQLLLVVPKDDEIATLDEVFDALHSHRVDDMSVIEDGGAWRQNPHQ